MPSRPKGSAAGAPADERAPAPPIGTTSTPPRDHAKAAERSTLGPEPMAAAAEPALAGRTIGDFEFLQEIGRGGMGVVYKARQTSLDRVVAVKVLLAEHCQNPVLLGRFRAEARAVAGLAHPNIVAVYQVGHCAAGHYFAMEYIDGRSLEAIIQERTVPVAWALSLLIPVAEAIHFAHGKAVIHRDLKPANIMIDQLRRPVVMDFGLAKVVGKSSALTQYGVLMGTPAYMSPEQAGEGGGEVGPASDVYSLGAILYRLLAGRVPYEGRTPLSTLAKVISPKPPPPVRDFRPDVPGALEAICLKCLNKRAGDRYHSAHALAEDLRHFRTAANQTPAPPSARGRLPTVTLVAQPGGKAVQLFQATTVIGRASECDFVLRAADVSKHHCRIVVQENQVVLEDLGSSNGTCVNGRRVKRARLRDGDELDVGGHLFRVRLRAPK